MVSSLKLTHSSYDSRTPPPVRLTDLSSGFEPIDLVATIQLIQIFSLAEAEHGYASLPPTFELDSPAVVSLVNGTKVRDIILIFS